MKPHDETDSASPAASADADSLASRWLARWAVAAGLIAGLTFVVATWPEALDAWIGAFNLGMESNVAAWFSASSLLWAGLLFCSAGAARRRRSALEAAAMFVTGGLAIALSVDEAGSLHERFDLLVPAAFGLSLEGFGGILALPALLSVGVLFARRRTFGHAAVLILGAYALFGSVFVQEKLEHGLEWPPALLPLRMLVEEGIELCGFYLLLRAAIGLGRCCRTPQAGEEVDAVSRWTLVLPARGPLVAAFGVAAVAGPLLILWSLSIPIVELSLFNRGDFGSTMSMSMFLIAGALCFDRAVSAPHAAAAAARTAWAAVGFGCVLLSLVQNWHAYTDAYELVLGRFPPHLFRTAYDMIWAMPVFIVLTLAFRRPLGLRWWVAACFAVAWATCAVAAHRAGFRLSYASSYASALVVGVWVLLATRPGHAKSPGPA